MAVAAASLACPLCALAFDASQHVRWRKDGFEIVECPRCSLVFRAALPDRGELGAIYDSRYFVRAQGDAGGQGYLDYLADEELHRRSGRRRLTLLERFVDRGRLLDVGAAAGFFVDEARKRGWEARGVDVAETMARWGAEHLGVELATGEIGDLELPSGSLDAVTMWDYVEHAYDPRRDVAEAARLLRAGGVLALSTGDVGSLVARLSGARWHLLTPRHHNFFFSARTLRALLEGAGFEVASFGHPGSSYTVSYLGHKSRTLLDSGATRALARALERSPLGRLAIPVNLRDILTVVARKRR